MARCSLGRMAPLGGRVRLGWSSAGQAVCDADTTPHDPALGRASRPSPRAGVAPHAPGARGPRRPARPSEGSCQTSRAGGPKRNCLLTGLLGLSSRESWGARSVALSAASDPEVECDPRDPRRALARPRSVKPAMSDGKLAEPRKARANTLPRTHSRPQGRRLLAFARHIEPCCLVRCAQPVRPAGARLSVARARRRSRASARTCPGQGRTSRPVQPLCARGLTSRRGRRAGSRAAALTAPRGGGRCQARAAAIRQAPCPAGLLPRARPRQSEARDQASRCAAAGRVIVGDGRGGARWRRPKGDTTEPAADPKPRKCSDARTGPPRPCGGAPLHAQPVLRASPARLVCPCL